MTRRPLPGVSLTLLTSDGRYRRTLALSSKGVRWFLALSGLGLAALGVMVGTWWYFALRSLEADDLRRQVIEQATAQADLAELATTLELLEAEYMNVRNLLALDSAGVSSDLWLPLPATSRSAGSTADLNDPLPTGWPLSSPGFVTQDAFAAAAPDHAGLDIAVAMHSYIRAAGAGVVKSVDDDAIYGTSVQVEHEGGYLTRYAHAAAILVEVGQSVRKGEVIGLSGSSGRSSAPHLHFEITLDGVPVDPLTLLTVPEA